MSMAVKASTGPNTPQAVLTRGLWHENPVLVQTLGLCSALAVTNAVANSLAMGLATAFVLVCSSAIVSLMRKYIANEIRITTYILIIATFIAVADLSLEAIVPEVHKSLGAYIALIVTNCIVLGRQEAFASRNTVGLSVLDALGNGTFLGVRVMPDAFDPWVVMMLPPGGFFMIGVLLLVANWHDLRKVARARAAGRAAVPTAALAREPAEALV